MMKRFFPKDPAKDVVPLKQAPVHNALRNGTIEIALEEDCPLNECLEALEVLENNRTRNQKNIEDSYVSPQSKIKLEETNEKITEQIKTISGVLPSKIINAEKTLVANLKKNELGSIEKPVGKNHLTFNTDPKYYLKESSLYAKKQLATKGSGAYTAIENIEKDIANLNRAKDRINPPQNNGVNPFVATAASVPSPATAATATPSISNRKDNKPM